MSTDTASRAVTVSVPIRAESLNRAYAEHWAKRHRRNTSHQLAVYTALRAAKAPHTVPCVVTLTRVAPRPIDSHDNLRGSTKACVDAVALWLNVDDADERVQWQYAQRRGGVREYAVLIEVAPA
jgi:hypothetical protein